MSKHTIRYWDGSVAEIKDKDSFAPHVQGTYHGAVVEDGEGGLIAHANQKQKDEEPHRWLAKYELLSDEDFAAAQNNPLASGVSLPSVTPPGTGPEHRTEEEQASAKEQSEAEAREKAEAERAQQEEALPAEEGSTEAQPREQPPSERPTEG
jgi:hypothetical protein